MIREQYYLIGMRNCLHANAVDPVRCILLILCKVTSSINWNVVSAPRVEFCCFIYKSNGYFRSELSPIWCIVSLKRIRYSVFKLFCCQCYSRDCEIWIFVFENGFILKWNIFICTFILELYFSRGFEINLYVIRIILHTVFFLINYN